MKSQTHFFCRNLHEVSLFPLRALYSRGFFRRIGLVKARAAGFDPERSVVGQEDQFLMETRTSSGCMIMMATQAKPTTWTPSGSLPPMTMEISYAWTWLAGASGTTATPCKRGIAMAEIIKNGRYNSIIMMINRGSGKHPPAREKNWSSAEARKYPSPAPVPTRTLPHA